MLNRQSFAFVLCTLLVAALGQSANAITSVGLIQDLDANSLIGADGSTVNSWVPSVGDTVNLAGGGAGNPTLQVGAINGNNAVRFSNNSRLIGDDASLFDSNINGSGYTWIAVVDAGNNTTANQNRIFGTLINAGPFSGQTADVENNKVASHNRFGGGVSMGATDVDAGFFIAGGRLGAGLGSQIAEVFMNSTTADGSSNVNVGVSDAGAISIGSERTGGTEFFDGDIARILIWNRAISDEELNEAGFQLARTYGLQTNFAAPPVPEPATAMFLLTAAGALGMRRRRQTA